MDSPGSVEAHQPSAQAPSEFPRRVTRADAFPEPSDPPPPPLQPLSPETVVSLEAIRASDAARSAVKSFAVSLLLGVALVAFLAPSVRSPRSGAPHSAALKRQSARDEVRRAEAQETAQRTAQGTAQGTAQAPDADPNPASASTSFTADWKPNTWSVH